MAFAAPGVILRGGHDDLTPIFWSWQRTKNGRCLLREPLISENVLSAALRCRALGTVSSKIHFDRRGLFAPGRDFIGRLGTPTRTTGIQAGGLPPGNGSIRLWGSASSTSR